MRITHLGHSCLLVEQGDARLLIDPGTFSHGFTELTGLDAVLVTHVHPDHLDAARLPGLVDANDGVRVIAQPEAVAELEHIGIEATPFRAGDAIELGPFAVTGAGEQHALIHADVPRIGNTGFVVRAGGTSLFHPGDMLDAVPADVDVLAVPIAAPWSALKETVDFVRAVSPARAVPIHDAVLSTIGRTLILRVLGGLLPDGCALDDLTAAPGDY